jgi:hypothetical protein
VVLEGRTQWPRVGVSVYFRDPDDHLLEIATPGLWRGTKDNNRCSTCGGKYHPIVSSRSRHGWIALLVREDHQGQHRDGSTRLQRHTAELHRTHR